VANMNKFDEFRGFDERPAACAVCESMLPEAVDGLLSGAELQVFNQHVAGCVECARELAEAQRGAAWLSLLKSQTPEPPAGLLAKILAETSGSAQHHSSPVATAIPASIPAWQAAPLPVAIQPHPGSSSPWAAFRKQLSDVFSIETARATFQPRMAMTAAMAFFSIALTLNLTGVRLRDLRASNFTPSAIKRTVADVDASATRMFQNNRAVYQVESRLSELRNDDSTGDSSPAERR
jgi:anti-sigma factor RsiW